MKKSIVVFLFLLLSVNILQAQSIEKKWLLEKVNGVPEEIFAPQKGAYLLLDQGQLSYSFNNASQKLRGDY